jgi:hypothetical protein
MFDIDLLEASATEAHAVAAHGIGAHAIEADAVEASATALDASVLSDDELLASTDDAWVVVGRAHRRLLDRLREIDRREAWRDEGAEDSAHWVSIR